MSDNCVLNVGACFATAVQPPRADGTCGQAPRRVLAGLLQGYQPGPHICTGAVKRNLALLSVYAPTQNETGRSQAHLLPNYGVAYTGALVRP